MLILFKMLPRGQKLCPECKEPNAIRNLKCKKCKFNFPKKVKNVETSKNTSIETFLRQKRTLPPSKEAELEVSVPKPIRNENGLVELLAEKEVYLNYENSKDFVLKENEKEKIISFKNEDKRLEVFLPQASRCTRFSFDCISTDKTIYTSILQVTDENKVYLIYITLDNLNPLSTFLYLLSTTQKNYYFTIKTKLIQPKKNPSHVHIICVIDNQLFCLLPSSNALKNVFIIEKNFSLSKIESIFCNDNTIKLIFSDINNQLFYYCYNIKDSKEPCKKRVKCLGLFEGHFQSKITDIKFLKEEKILFYFAVCSRDGLLKILDSNNNVILKHKTYQTWITQITFDNENDIIFFLTNFDDKIVGIKLNNKKEPIIKRIPEANNAYSLSINQFEKKIYYLDNQGKIYFMKTFWIEDMFKTYKSKKKSEFKPCLIEEIEEKVKLKMTNYLKVLNVQTGNDYQTVLVTQVENLLNFASIVKKNKE